MVIEADETRKMTREVFWNNFRLERQQGGLCVLEEQRWGKNVVRLKRIMKEG